MKPKKNNTVVNFVAKHRHPPSRRDDRKTRAYNGRERDRVFKRALARVKYRTSNYHVKMKTRLNGQLNYSVERVIMVEGSLFVSSFYLKRKMIDWLVIEQTWNIAEDSYIIHNFKKHFHIFIFFVFFFNFVFSLKKISFLIFSTLLYFSRFSIFITDFLTIFPEQEIVNIVELLLYFMLLF